jgi:Na+/H+ antiporter NhaD/arsenite permease-like protein
MATVAKTPEIHSPDDRLGHAPAGDVGQLSSKKFLLGCLIVAVGLTIMGRWVTFSPWLLAGEVFATILALFVFGSIKYQIHKNALTYGAALVITATFWSIWWPASELRQEVAAEGNAALWHAAREQLLTFHGLDQLIHLDTMLFILGLTFFVSVIAQTRLLENITFFLLRRNHGCVLPTVLCVTGVVAFASGILDGVSMIGLTIRTLVIILLLAQAPVSSIRYAVMVCTVVTTVCGMWLAYGEPPNLIMKANLVGAEGRPLLTDAFFLRYCAPAALLSFIMVALSLRKRLRGKTIDLAKMDVLDANIATVRFMQANRFGKVLTPVEFVETHEAELGEAAVGAVAARIFRGQTIGRAMVEEGVPEAVRRKVLGEFVMPTLADDLDDHYVKVAAGHPEAAAQSERHIHAAIRRVSGRRLVAQTVGALALAPFVGLLVAHALHHQAVPLYWASCAGFAFAMLGIVTLPKMRWLALREAWHEYGEYFFLFPLFLSISLLARVGFFDQLQGLLRQGIEHLGSAHIAFGQFAGATVLSAMLDNNVVADFSSRALHGLELGLIYLFSMAQIAGYAAGGCWTHIGSAQSVVAFAFIRRDVDARFTPFQWIREMTPVLLATVLALSVMIYVRAWFSF